MTWERGVMMVMKDDVGDYLNHLEEDFREVIIKRIKNACCIDREHSITLYGNTYHYVNDECTDITKISWQSIHCDNIGRLYVKYIEEDNIFDEKKNYNQYLDSLSTEMLMDIVQNI